MRRPQAAQLDHAAPAIQLRHRDVGARSAHRALHRARPARCLLTQLGHADPDCVGQPQNPRRIQDAFLLCRVAVGRALSLVWRVRRALSLGPHPNSILSLRSRRHIVAAILCRAILCARTRVQGRSRAVLRALSRALLRALSQRRVVRYGVSGATAQALASTTALFSSFWAVRRVLRECVSALRALRTARTEALRGVPCLATLLLCASRAQSSNKLLIHISCARPRPAGCLGRQLYSIDFGAAAAVAGLAHCCDPAQHMHVDSWLSKFMRLNTLCAVQLTGEDLFSYSCKQFIILPTIACS